MPRQSEAPAEKQIVRQLLIADAKVGKSHYAGIPAAHGFNVLYLDGDVAAPTLAGLPAAAKQNIYRIDCGDKTIDGRISPDFSYFMKDFMREPVLYWDDTNSRIVTRKDAEKIKESEIWELRPARLDSSWVLVIDSWTAIVNSCKLWAANGSGVDLMETSTPEMRGIYRASGDWLTQLLVFIQRMPCHVIVLAHPSEYQKKVAPENKRVQDLKETDYKIEWTKQVPLSSSGPHSLTMAKFFTDVAWLEMNRAGSERVVNFKPDFTRVAGGHFDDKKNVDDYAFHNLVKQVGGRVNPANAPIEPALVMHGCGAFEFPQIGKKVLEPAKANDSTTVPKAGAAVGLASLLNKGK